MEVLKTYNVKQVPTTDSPEGQYFVKSDDGLILEHWVVSRGAAVMISKNYSVNLNQRVGYSDSVLEEGATYYLFVPWEPSEKDGVLKTVTFAKDLPDDGSYKFYIGIFELYDDNGALKAKCVSMSGEIPITGKTMNVIDLGIEVKTGQSIGFYEKENPTRAITLQYPGPRPTVCYIKQSWPNAPSVDDLIDFYPYNQTFGVSAEIQQSQGIEEVIEENRVKVESLIRPNTEMSWCTLGDSITWYDAHPNGSTITKGYQTRVAEKLIFSAVNNIGVSARKMTDQADNIAEIPAADLYTIMYGTNDYHNDPIQSMGAISDYTGKTYSSSNKTFYGAIREIVDACYVQNGNCKIVFITPIWSDRTIPNSGIATANPGGYTLKDYVNAIKECCAVDAIPVIDLFSKCQINRSNVSVYTIDNIHPNDEGFQLIANQIIPVFKDVLGL